MLTHEITLTIYQLVLIVGFSVFAGFAFRAKTILKCRGKIEELEREVLSTNSTILDLERETMKLHSQMEDIKIPVIAMKPAPKEKGMFSVKKPR